MIRFYYTAAFSALLFFAATLAVPKSALADNPNALKPVVIHKNPANAKKEDSKTSSNTLNATGRTTTTTRRTVTKRVVRPGRVVHRRVYSRPVNGIYMLQEPDVVYVERPAPVVYVEQPVHTVYEGGSQSTVYVTEREPSYASRRHQERSDIGGGTFLRWYLQVSGAYSGLQADKGQPVFEGIAFAVTAGFGFPFLAGELTLESSNHWLNELDANGENSGLSLKEGYPSGHNILSFDLGVKGILPIWFLEPYLGFSVGASVYHPDESLGHEPSSDWGFTAAAQVGLQIRIRNFAFGGGYAHRWLWLGARKAANGDIVEPRPELSKWNLHVSYAFDIW